MEKMQKKVPQRNRDRQSQARLIPGTRSGSKVRSPRRGTASPGSDAAAGQEEQNPDVHQTQEQHPSTDEDGAAPSNSEETFLATSQI
jgi:hypothetical protein